MNAYPARQGWQPGRFLMDRAQASSDAALHLYCPGARDLPLEHLVALALLPIHDWNGELLKALATARPVIEPNISACVLAADPFRRLRDLLEELRQNNFRWVTNFPSTEAIDGGMRATLDDLGFGLEKELRFVEEAVSVGLSVAAFATSTSSALMMVERGATAIIATDPTSFDTAKLPAGIELVRLETQRQS